VAFNSHTDGGHLKYTLPSIMEIHGKPYEAFGLFEYITYDVSIMDFDQDTQQLKNLACDVRNPWPIMYYLSPQVVYSGSDVSFMVDPRYAHLKKSSTLPEFPFLEVRLNGYGVDFEGFLEENTVLNVY
jgi:hypothetical protein